MKIKPDSPLDMTMKVRIPGWSEKTAITTEKAYSLKDGYAVFSGRFDIDTEIILELDMSVKVSYPEAWDADEIYTDMDKIDNRWYAAKKKTVYHDPEDDAVIMMHTRYGV